MITIKTTITLNDKELDINDILAFVKHEYIPSCKFILNTGEIIHVKYENDIYSILQTLNVDRFRSFKIRVSKFFLNKNRMSNKIIEVVMDLINEEIDAILEHNLNTHYMITRTSSYDAILSLKF